MTITNYIITPVNVDTGTQLPAITVPGNATYFDITSLATNTTYKFLIYAQDSAGDGAVATSPTVLLGSGTPPPVGGGGPPTTTVPGAPSNLTGTVGIGTVSLGWSTPSSDGGSTITGYTISYNISGQAVQTQSVGVVTNAIIGSLSNNETYIVKVAAINAVGIGPYSAEQHFSTTSQVLVYNLVSWPYFNNEVQNFTVASVAVPTQFNGLTAISRDLTTDTLYKTPNELFPAHDEIGKVTFRTAKRKVGPYRVGTDTNASNNYYDPPGNTVVTPALQNLTSNIVKAGLGTVTPYPDAGFIQDMLKYSARPGDILKIYKKFKSYFSLPTLFQIDKGAGVNTEWKTNRYLYGCENASLCLMPGWAYEYTHTRPFLRFDTRDLTAANVITRAFLTFKKDSNCPIVNPEGLSLKFVKVGDTVSDSKLNSSDYNNIEGTVLATLPLTDPTLQSGALVTLNISNTSFIKPFGFTKIIITTNLEGGSLPTNWTQVTLQDVRLSIALDVSSVTAPGEISYVVPTPADKSISIEWGAPIVDGGSAITSYLITEKASGNISQVSAEALKGVYTKVWTEGLSNDIAYSFNIAASNVKGTGQGTIFTATPSATPTLPDSVRDFYALPEDGKVTLSWYSPLDTGTSPITGYQIDNQTTGDTVTALSSATSLELSGLANGTVYTISIIAKNSTGGSPSTVTTVTPTSGYTVPARPVITGKYATEGRVTVFWTAPENYGGDPLIGFVVTLDAPGVPHYVPINFSISDPFAIEYTISGIATGNTYIISVAAVNSTGTGPYAVSDSFTVSSNITDKGLFVPVDYSYQKFFEAPIDLNIHSKTYQEYLYPQDDSVYAETTPAYAQSDPFLLYPVSVSSNFSVLYFKVTSPSTGPIDYAIDLLKNPSPVEGWTPENTAKQINDICNSLDIPLGATALAGQRLSVFTKGNFIGEGITISLSTLTTQKSANTIVFGNNPFIANGTTLYPVKNHVPTAEYDAVNKKALVESRVWLTVRNFDASRSSLYTNYNDSIHGNNYTIDLVGNLRPNGVTIQYFDRTNKLVTLRDYLGDGRILYRLKSSTGPGDPITFTYPKDVPTGIDPSDRASSFGSIDYDTGEITNLIFPTFTTSTGVLYPTFKPAIVIGKGVTWPVYVKDDSRLYLVVNNVTTEFIIPKNELVDGGGNTLPLNKTTYSAQDIVDLLNAMTGFVSNGLVAGVSGGQLFIQNIGIGPTNLRINIGPTYNLTLFANDNQYINQEGDVASCNELLFGIHPNQQPPTKIYITYSYTNNDSSPYRYIWYATPHFILRSAGGPTQFITKGHLNYLLDKLTLFRPAVSTLDNIEFVSSFEDTTNVTDIISISHTSCTPPYIQEINRPPVTTDMMGISVSVKVINPHAQEDIKPLMYTYE